MSSLAQMLDVEHIHSFAHLTAISNDVVDNPEEWQGTYEKKCTGNDFP